MTDFNELYFYYIFIISFVYRAIFYLLFIVYDDRSLKKIFLVELFYSNELQISTQTILQSVLLGYFITTWLLKLLYKVPPHSFL